MININYLKLLRSQNKSNKNNFIYNIISKRIIDSLDLLKISFDKSLEIGINDNLIYNYLKSKNINSFIERADICSPKIISNSQDNIFEVDLNNLILKKNNYNLVYSNFFMHLFPNFEKNLYIISNSLKPNGFFISIIPDKENIYQLVNSMYEADLILYKGVHSRFNPTLEIENILTVLKKLNFNSPTIYSDKITIEYSSFYKMLNEIKNMSLSYTYIDKRQKFENKKYFQILKDIYKKKYFDGNYILDLKINIISAWKI